MATLVHDVVRRSRSIAAIAVVGLLASPVGAAVLKTIGVDGNLSDWSDVLAEPLQRADEGPLGGLPDADAPVPSTGRDLTTFAWTYDATHLFLYVARAGSESNIQRFWFYIDSDEDGRMETGEPVVLVEWYGSSRRTDIARYDYRPAAVAGDPLAGAAGLADGWDMPGTVSSRRTIETLYGGAASGTAMESRISWTNLGIAPGAAVLFHVASSAGTNLPSQVADNMGGPGGRVGTTRLNGVRLEPDRAAFVARGGTVAFAHVVTNTGMASDRFDLTWTASGTFAPTGVAWHRDLDADGVLDAGEPALSDTDASGVVDTGSVAPATMFPLLAVVTTPAAAIDGQTSTLTLRAAAAALPAVFDTAVDTITIATPSVTLVKAVSRGAAAPGDRLVYTIAYSVGGSAPAYAVEIVDAVPADSDYVVGSAAGAGASISFSTDGGASYGPSALPGTTHIRWVFSSPLALGSSGGVSFEVAVR